MGRWSWSLSGNRWAAGGAEIPKSASDPTRRTREVSDPAGWEVEHGPADLVLTVQQLDSAD